METKVSKFLVPMKLQYFNGEGEVIRGGYNPDEEISYPENASNPLAEEPNEPNEPVAQPDNEPVNEPPNNEPPSEPNNEPPVFDFGGRKVNPNDPESIQGAHEDFQQSQRYIQQLIQENRQMQQQFQQFQEQYQQSQPQQQEPEVDIEKQNEEMMEKFYDNPTQFFQELKQQAVEEAKKLYEPIERERKMQTEIESVSSKYQDFNEFVPKMQELVQELGEETTEQLGLERVYLMAKGQTAQPQQMPSPEQLMQDPNFVNQYVLNNPQIQQQIMQNYMSQKQQSQPPKVMGNTYGGTQSLASEQRPKSIGEASRLLRKSWGV